MMKKVIGLAIVLLLCTSFAVPTFASSGGFVDSITVKPAPELVIGNSTVKVDGTDTQQKTEEIVIEIKNENNETVYSAPVTDLVITAVSQVQADSPAVAISEEAAEVLKEAYDQLNDEQFKISEQSVELTTALQEKLVADIETQVIKLLEEQGAAQEIIDTVVANAKETVTAESTNLMDAAVVTALFDVSIVSEEMDEHLSVEGNSIDLTFAADVPENHAVVVMVYKENTWQLIENVVVNADGTITCTFAHFCPVAIMAVPLDTIISEETVTEVIEVAAQTIEASAAAAEAKQTGLVWAVAGVAVVAAAFVMWKRKGAKK